MTGRARDCVVAAHTCLRDAIIDVNQNAGNRVLERTLLNIADWLKGILDDDFADRKRASEEARGREEAASAIATTLGQSATPRSEDAR